MADEVIEQPIEKTQEQVIEEAVQARLKEEREKIYRGSLNEGKERERKQWAGIFEKHGLQIGENPEEAITNLLNTVKQSQTKTKETEEEVSAKIQSALEKARLAEQAMAEAVAEKNSFILQSKVVNAIGSKAVNANAAMTLLMNEYKMELAKDGSVKVKTKSGDMVRNEIYEPADLDYVVNSFLEKNPYLAKATERKTDTQIQGDVTNGSIDFLKRPRSEWTEAQVQQAIDMVKKGKIVNNNGVWQVK